MTQSDDSVLINQKWYSGVSTKFSCEKPSKVTRKKLISTSHSILAPFCAVPSGAPTADISVLQTPPSGELGAKLPKHLFHTELLSHQMAPFYATNDLDYLQVSSLRVFKKTIGGWMSLIASLIQLSMEWTNTMLLKREKTYLPFT